MWITEKLFTTNQIVSYLKTKLKMFSMKFTLQEMILPKEHLENA